MPIKKLSLSEKEIILVGTAHVSRDSVDEVREAIEEYQPDVVAVELCPGRYEVLKNPKNWQEMDIVKVIKEKKAAFLFANLLLASFQRRIGEKLGVRPGQEMAEAVKVAEEHGLEVALVDRPIQPTLQRAWRFMGFWQKLKLVWQGLLSIFSEEEIDETEVENLKETDMLTAAVDEFGREAPVIKEVLIDERDAYMAAKLAAIESPRVLAVVGAGHMAGIERRLAEPPANTARLEEVPAKKKGWGKWVIPVIIFAIVFWGFLQGGAEQGYEMVKWWLLCNAIFAALGAAIALGHPLTILVAGIASPITSLNPTLAAGWFAGLCEAWVKKPRVADFETLQEDITSVKGFWHNSITRILMVVIFANLGSSLGAVLAMPVLTKIMLQ